MHASHDHIVHRTNQSILAKFFTVSDVPILSLSLNNPVSRGIIALWSEVTSEASEGISSNQARTCLWKTRAPHEAPPDERLGSLSYGMGKTTREFLGGSPRLFPPRGPRALEVVVMHAFSMVKIILYYV